MSGITLTENQQSVLEDARNWDGKKLTIGGYAGTGKTSLIKEMLKDEHYKEWAVASFTGKAVEVLRTKGIDRAQTIHNLMYHVIMSKKDIEFKRAQSLGRAGVIIDEASMVDLVLYRDLVKFKLPIIWVGDMGQLEPIGDDPRLMHDPDLKLTQIHRQALESPIIRLSMLIRQGESMSAWRAEADDVELSIRRQNEGTYQRMVEFAAREGTMVICGFNRTRTDVNKGARRIRGYSGPVSKGDKMICLANESQHCVFNGMVGIVVDEPEHLGGHTYSLQIAVQGEEKPRCMTCDLGPIIDPKFDKKKWLYEAMERRKDGGNDLTLWDHAYAITCHKAQGSEADEVAVWDQQCELWDSVRWRYTAVTRARKKLVYCV